MAGRPGGETAHAFAAELTAIGPFAAHVEAELGLDPNDLTSPTHPRSRPGWPSPPGAILPVAAITLAPANIRIVVTFVAVLSALVPHWAISARLGGAGKSRAVLRLALAAPPPWS